jgi:hypothetical protein
VAEPVGLLRPGTHNTTLDAPTILSLVYAVILIVATVRARIVVCDGCWGDAFMVVIIPVSLA